MQRILLVAAVLALPLAAQAQQANYCSGGVVADRFDTVLTSGISTRATYKVLLRNTQSADRRLQITVLGSIQDRPTAPHMLRGGRSDWVTLGYQTILSAGQALRGQALENVLRISCV